MSCETHALLLAQAQNFATHLHEIIASRETALEYCPQILPGAHGCAFVAGLDADEGGKDIDQPFVDVILRQILLQASHAVRLFLRRHLQGLTQRLCHAFCIVGIDEQGIAQFFSRASKLAAQ